MKYKIILLISIFSCLCSYGQTNFYTDDLVFRGDHRSPQQLKRTNGFRAPGLNSDTPNTSLFHHISVVPHPHSIFISTTRNFNVANRFIAPLDEGGASSFLQYIYCFSPNGFLDSRAILGEHHPQESEEEFTAVGTIPWTQIRGWYEVYVGGSGEIEQPNLIRDYIPNPDYDSSFDQPMIIDNAYQFAGFPTGHIARREAPWSIYYPCESYRPSNNTASSRKKRSIENKCINFSSNELLSTYVKGFYRRGDQSPKKYIKTICNSCKKADRLKKTIIIDNASSISPLDFDVNIPSGQCPSQELLSFINDKKIVCPDLWFDGGENTTKVTGDFNNIKRNTPIYIYGSSRKIELNNFKFTTRSGDKLFFYAVDKNFYKKRKKRGLLLKENTKPEDGLKEKIVLHPNPIKKGEDFYITLKEKQEGDISISIVSVYNKLTKVLNYTSEDIISGNRLKVLTNGIKEGIYIVTIKTDRYSERKKLVIN